MNVADVMTKDVASCRAGDSVNRAAQLMWERRCGCIPVLDEAGRVIGIVTDRDACMAAYTQGRRLDEIAVNSAMSRPALTCEPSAAITDAEDLMMAYGIHRLVVVDWDGRPSGIVSLDDIARNGADWNGKSDVDLERVAITLGEISQRNGVIDKVMPNPESPETDVSELVRNSLAVLQTLRHEIRVDLKLAGEEVRNRWRRLEARLHAAEIHAREARHEASRDLAGLVQTAKRFQSQLRENA